jgi:hypothetical protein
MLIKRSLLIQKPCLTKNVCVSGLHLRLREPKCQRLRRQGVAPLPELVLPARQQLEPQIYQIRIQRTASRTVSSRRTRSWIIYLTMTCQKILSSEFCTYIIEVLDAMLKYF